MKKKEEEEKKAEEKKREDRGRRKRKKKVKKERGESTISMTREGGQQPPAMWVFWQTIMCSCSFHHATLKPPYVLPISLKIFEVYLAYQLYSALWNS